jgi:hypothetical protein
MKSNLCIYAFSRYSYCAFISECLSRSKLSGVVKSTANSHPDILGLFFDSILGNGSVVGERSPALSIEINRIVFLRYLIVGI